MKRIKAILIGDRGMVGEIIKKKLIKKQNKIKIKLLKGNIKNVKNIKRYKIIIFCKEEKESIKTFKKLKKKKWNNYWVDASSCFRRCKKSIIVLDPINKKAIKKAIINKKILCGGNCTVSIMLIAIKKLIKKNLIKEIDCITFQSISGTGYKNTIKKLKKIKKRVKKPFKKIINIKELRKNEKVFSITPWIGKNLKEKIPEEELKGEIETNKILKSAKYKEIKINSTCVRVETIRCHAMSLTLRLKKNIKNKKFEKYLKNNKHAKVIKNSFKETIKKLNPNKIAGKEKIYIGRIKKIKKKKYSIFLIGDQLIWGASKPIIRTIEMIRKYEKNKNKILRNKKKKRNKKMYRTRN